MSKSVYILNFGRPFGCKPTIYLNKPQLADNYDNPFGGPEIEEFPSEIEARRYFKQFYPDSYKELKVEV